MGNTIKGFTITMQEPIDEVHADRLKKAFAMMNGVAHVSIDIMHCDDMQARTMERIQLAKALGSLARKIIAGTSGEEIYKAIEEMK